MSLSELLATTKGKVTVAAEAIALVAMAPFLLIEGSTMVAYLKVCILESSWDVCTACVTRWL